MTRNPFGWWRNRRRRRVLLAHERRARQAQTVTRTRVLLAVIFFAAITLLFPLTLSFQAPTYMEGMISTEEIIADFSFDVPKPDDMLERERALAAEAVRPVFTRITRKPSYERVIAELRAASRDSTSLRALEDSLGFTLSRGTRELLRQRDLAEVLLFETERLLNEVNDAGFISTQDANLLQTKVEVGLRTERGDEIVSTLDLYDARRLGALAAERGMEKVGPRGSTALKQLAEGLARPNLRFDPVLTEANREAARQSVSPVLTHIQKDERIIDANERITKDHLLVLEGLQRALVSRAASQHLTSWVYPFLGRLLLALVLLAVFAGYLRASRPDVWQDPGLLTLVLAVSVLTLGLASVVARTGALHPFGVPIPMAAILISMLVGTGPAVAASVVLALVLGFLTPWGLSFVLVAGTGGTLAAFAVSNAFHRLDLLRAALPIALGMLFLAAAGHLAGNAVPSQLLLREALWVLGNAAVSIALAMSLLPLLEKLFGLASNLTLLELSDLNRPIFKRMVIEANGTYHHSMVVGLLSEAAAEATDANPLLARVGAYYHDIGKIAKAGYFGENLRRGMKNPHEKLTPTMSSLILESHVREGLEMAREIGLPKKVADFIPEHQGTTLMQYFYTKAMEQDPEVEERDYRYPGPIPQCKETGIVMLADAAEATVRSLDDQSPQAIRGVLARLFEARIADGQLDACGLTISDLARVRDAFTHVLSGVHHSRVKYQWQKQGGEGAPPGDPGERIFRPELETGISETHREFARTSQASRETPGS